MTNRLFAASLGCPHRANNPKVYEVKRHLVFGMAVAAEAHLQTVRKRKTPTTNPPPPPNEAG